MGKRKKKKKRESMNRGEENFHSDLQVFSHPFLQKKKKKWNCFVQHREVSVKWKIFTESFGWVIAMFCNINCKTAVTLAGGRSVTAALPHEKSCTVTTPQVNHHVREQTNVTLLEVAGFFTLKIHFKSVITFYSHQGLKILASPRNNDSIVRQ